LANFPTAAWLSHLISKGEFPHSVNCRENWDEIIDFPTPADYMLEARTSQEIEAFLKWYKKERKSNGGKFHFRDQIA